jgi:hypothetical protein
MSDSIVEPFLKGNTGRNTRGILRLSILCLIAAAAVASRLFSVIRTYLEISYQVLQFLHLETWLELSHTSEPSQTLESC